jgi:catechol 2,3-dioxygenase-like lactoylglutathione lyase family enzyme
MKKIALLVVVGILQLPTPCQTSHSRPRITGIDHVAFYTTQPDGVRRLYVDILGLASAAPIEPGSIARYMVGRQWVGYSGASDLNATDRMDHVAFTTDNVIALRRYLAAHDLKPSRIEGRSDHSLTFSVNDPEEHRIEFVERGKASIPATPETAVSHRMIHAGFIVHHADLEDHFYRDILGFRPYWHGGMKDNETDWISLQVPDGTDWLEYMLNQPEHPDLRLSGVMNHISLGVADMKKAQAALEAHGWKEHDGEHAQIGRDGKRQLNVFDPDLTRIELMEFTPTQKPCCSEFTGPHPSE